MTADSRADTLTALIYDSALISRIHEMYTQAVRSFVRRADPGILTHRFVSVVTFYFICRLIHPSTRTPGEELLAQNPPQSVPLRIKVAMFLSSLSIPFLKEVMVPLVKQWSLDLGYCLEIVVRAGSDAFFFLNPRARTTSIIEEYILPRRANSIKSHVSIPNYLFQLSGYAVLLKCVQDMYSIYRRRSVKRTLITSNFESLSSNEEDKPSPGCCPVCMCDIVRPTATLCGHIFCWECSMSWVVPDGKPCPICRTVSHPQDLLPLTAFVPANSDWKPFWNRPLILDR